MYLASWPVGQTRLTAWAIPAEPAVDAAECVYPVSSFCHSMVTQSCIAGEKEAASASTGLADN